MSGWGAECAECEMCEVRKVPHSCTLALLAPSHTSARLLDGLLQRLACGEPRHAALRNVDRCAGLRIARLACFAVRRLERAEPDERHGVALPQRLRDAVDQRIDGGRRTGLGDARVLGDFDVHIMFVHETSLSIHRRAFGAPAAGCRKTPGSDAGKRRPPADASRETCSGYTSVCSKSPESAARSEQPAAKFFFWQMTAALRILRGFLLCRALDRFFEHGIGRRRGLPEFDVGLVDGDRRLETLFVERISRRRQIL